MSRTKNASRNLFWGFIYRIVTLVFPFITRTVMIYTLGMDYVGLGSLFSSILTVLSFAELGIGSALVYSMYEPIGNGDDKKVCALLNLYRKTYRVIGIIILVAGLITMPFLNYLVAGDVPQGINLQILFSMYLMNNLIGYFLFAYKQSLFTASQRVDIITKVNMVLNVICNIAQIVVLLSTHNYYLYVLIVPAITVLNNISVGVLSEKEFPQYRCCGDIDSSEKKDIEKKVGGMLFQKIGSIILTSADTIVISAFMGLKVLGIYNGYYYVITALLGFFGVIQQSIIPSIGNSIVTESVEKNLNNFKIFQLFYIWIVMWCCSCMLCLYQPFIRIWQGSGNMLSDSIVVLFVIYFFVYKMGDVGWMYREAMGLWWEARYVSLVSAIVNLGLNLLMVNDYGLFGVLLSTIVSIVFIGIPFNSGVLFSKYFKSRREYVKFLAKLVFYFLSMCVTAGITYLICSLVHGDGIAALAIKAVICCIVPNIILLVINFRNPDLKKACRFALGIVPARLVPYRVRRLLN